MPAAVSIVGAPTWGLIADRLGDVRPPLLVAGLVAAAVATLLFLRPEMPWLALVVIGIAAGASGLTPLLDARTVQRLGRDRERFGQVRVFGSIGFVVSSLLVGMLVQATQPEAMLAVYVPALAATGIVGAAVLGRGSRAVRAAGIGPRAAAGLLRDPGMGLFFVGSVVTWIAATGVMTFFSLRLLELGGDARLAGLGWAATASLEIPTMLAFRRLAAGSRVERLLVVGAALFAVRSDRLARSSAARPRSCSIACPRRDRLRPVPRRHDDVRRRSAHRRALQATAQALFAEHRVRHGIDPAARSSRASSPALGGSRPCSPRRRRAPSWGRC